MLLINLIFDILKDGKSHKIEDLKMEINFDNFEMQKLIAFLHKFDFIKIVFKNKVKAKKNFQRLISQNIK